MEVLSNLINFVLSSVNPINSTNWSFLKPGKSLIFAALNKQSQGLRPSLAVLVSILNLARQGLKHLKLFEIGALNIICFFVLHVKAEQSVLIVSECQGLI